MKNKLLAAAALLLGLLLAVYVQKSEVLRSAIHNGQQQEEEEEGGVVPNDEIDSSFQDDDVFLTNTTRTARLRALLQPRTLQFTNGTHTQALPHQLLHLHHMKTGGTSTDLLLRCAVHEFPKGKRVPYGVIHECGYTRYQKCIKGQDKPCVDKINNSAVISYCAPLSDLPIFGWTNATKIDKITTLRHPVDRVWSMYRFQTKSCYQCQSLQDVYRRIDAGDTKRMRVNCQNQLLNHMTRNMLSTKVPTADLNHNSLTEAVTNMESFVLGLTSRLEESVAGIKQVFPFMKDCELQHANSSPKNNRCGPGGTHKNLPDHPDAETRQIILEHNALDMELYTAALKQYKLQMRILKEMKEKGG